MPDTVLNDQLDEVKASMGDESEANDPVAAPGGNAKGKNRPADQNVTVDPKADTVDNVTPEGKAKPVKAPKRLADKAAVKEAVDGMFEGSDLTEDFKGKAAVIFESVVNTKIEESLVALEEQFDAQLDEQVELAVTGLAESVGSYLDDSVETWLEENKVAIDRGIQAEMAESLIAGLHTLFVEHNLDVSEEKVDVVESMSVEMDEMKAQLNDALNESIELKKTLAESEKVEAFDEIAEGLSDVQAEKLKKLSESVEHSDVSDFKSKVAILKENYFSKDKTALTEAADLDGEIETDKEVAIDPTMDFYANAISRNIGK